MSFVKLNVPGCCGTYNTVYDLLFALKQEQVIYFQDAGFFYSKPFYISGMLYIEDKNIIAEGVFGGNKLKIKYKNKIHDQSLIHLENVLNIIYNLK